MCSDGVRWLDSWKVEGWTQQCGCVVVGVVSWWCSMVISKITRKNAFDKKLGEVFVANDTA